MNTSPDHSAPAVGLEVPLEDADVPGYMRFCDEFIQREEAESRPRAARLPSDAERDRKGAAMRARRGIGALQA
jgi:hypothetical protein